MLDWYYTRTDTITHKDQNIPAGKKIRLTENQVKMVNQSEEKVVKCDPPKEPAEVGVFSEWHSWQTNITDPKGASGAALIDQAITEEPEEKNKEASLDKNEAENKGQVNPTEDEV